MSVYISRFPKMDDWVEFGHGVARTLVWESLFRDNRLRNGWGFSTYDLRQGEQNWIEQARQNPMGRDEQSTETLAGAQKRYNILKLMLEVVEGDMIIIPNVSETEPFNPKAFTVVTANGIYDFEDRSSNQLDYQQDFGHFIPVRNIRTFTQQDFRINFGAWQKAFNRIRNQRIHDFIARHYR